MWRSQINRGLRSGSPIQPGGLRGNNVGVYNQQRAGSPVIQGSKKLPSCCCGARRGACSHLPGCRPSRRADGKAVARARYRNTRVLHACMDAQGKHAAACSKGPGRAGLCQLPGGACPAQSVCALSCWHCAAKGSRWHWQSSCMHDGVHIAEDTTLAPRWHMHAATLATI